MFRKFTVSNAEAAAAAVVPRFEVGVRFFGTEAQKNTAIPHFGEKTTAFCESVAAAVTTSAAKLAGMVLPPELAGKFSAFAETSKVKPRDMNDKDLVHRDTVMTLQDVADQFCAGSLPSARVRMSKPDAPAPMFESTGLDGVWDAEMVEFYMSERLLNRYVRQHARECVKLRADEEKCVVSIMTEAASDCHKMSIDEAAELYWNKNKPALVTHLRTTGLIHKRDHEGKYLTSHLMPKKRPAFICGAL
ncbi:TPA: hypothetical protein JG871_003957 [Enterobacter hormaechei subsp. xiangfangensis]|nr:hypothetical protein [Enterobacter hormaechei subsp. xiangfangensis]